MTLPTHLTEVILREAEALYDKLDDAARGVDDYEFGLPMYEKQMQPIIDLLTEKYTKYQQLVDALEQLLTRFPDKKTLTNTWDIKAVIGAENALTQSKLK